MSTSRPIGIVAGCVFCRMISSSSDSCCTCDQTSPRCAPSHAPRRSPRAHLDHRPVRAVVALAHQRSQLRVQPRPRPVDPRSCRVEAAARADIRRDIRRDTRRGEQDTRARARERVHVGSAGMDWGAPAVHVEDRAEEVRLERVLAQRLRVRLERVPLAEIPCARRREPRDLGARVGVLRRRQQNVGDKRSGSNSGNGSGNETCSRPDSHSSAASAQSPSQSASACWQRIRPSVSSRLLLWPCSDCRRSYASRASAQR